MPADSEWSNHGHIVLTGAMGSGKTTIGRLLSRRLSRPFFDSDAQIEARYGVSARVLAEEEGVGRLHEIEARALETALQSEEACVVAAAASIGDWPELDRLLAGSPTVVLLDGEPEVLAARAGWGSHRRRMDVDHYRELSETRRRRLKDHVDLVVDVTAASPEDVVRTILAHRDQDAGGTPSDRGCSAN